jgi:hypothetical protein
MTGADAGLFTEVGDGAAFVEVDAGRLSRRAAPPPRSQ